MLPGAKFTAYPWDSFIPVKYQVAVEIVQLDSVLDKDVFLVVQWMVIDTRNTKPVIIKRSEFRQPVSPQTYSGFARTLSAVCVALSQEIAQAIAELD